MCFIHLEINQNISFKSTEKRQKHPRSTKLKVIKHDFTQINAHAFAMWRSQLRQQPTMICSIGWVSENNLKNVYYYYPEQHIQIAEYIQWQKQIKSSHLSSWMFGIFPNSCWLILLPYLFSAASYIISYSYCWHFFVLSHACVMWQTVCLCHCRRMSVQPRRLYSHSALKRKTITTNCEMRNDCKTVLLIPECISFWNRLLDSEGSISHSNWNHI